MRIADDIAVFTDKTVDIRAKFHELQLPFRRGEGVDALPICLRSTGNAEECELRRVLLTVILVPQRRAQGELRILEVVAAVIVRDFDRMRPLFLAHERSLNAGQRRAAFGKHLRHALRAVYNDAVVSAMHDDVCVSDCRRFRRCVKPLLTRVEKGIKLEAAFHLAFIVQYLFIRILRRAFPLHIISVQRFMPAAEYNVFVRSAHHVA